MAEPPATIQQSKIAISKAPAQAEPDLRQKIIARSEDGQTIGLTIFSITIFSLRSLYCSFPEKRIMLL